MIDEYIRLHREQWDQQHPKHDVIIEDGEGGIIVIPHDNSAMGCHGPMLTPEAVAFLAMQPVMDIDSIDGQVPDGYGI